jgi:2',3'-cyclic-nucleotide 2'-phosphodiesterase (5'-nucleotidase family)
MRYGILALLVLFLGACASTDTLAVHPEMLPVKSDSLSSNELTVIITPFRDSLRGEMDRVVGFSPMNMIATRPSSSLMNWVADAIFVDQTRTVRLSTPTFCLLNKGGIRSTINKGNITNGDVFKLMPFDNQIVWVQLPIECLKDIETYLRATGGEPIANARIENGKLLINGMREGATHFWVITSDYMMNGGDKATFFSKQTAVNHTGRLVRDAIMSEIELVGTISADTVARISF